MSFNQYVHRICPLKKLRERISFDGVVDDIAHLNTGKVQVRFCAPNFESNLNLKLN